MTHPDADLAPPIPYSPALEKPEADEAEITAELVKTMREIAEKVHADTGHPHRSVHAKAFAVMHGELIVTADLPELLRQGLFAEAATYPVTLRFSTPPGDLLSDRVSLARGLALKVHDVPGARLPGAEDGSAQDFVMVNGPVFNSGTAKSFLRSLKQLAATTDKAPKGKEMLSAVMRVTEKALEAVGGESALLKSMGGHPQTHPLGETFFTQTPLRFGDYVAKVSVKPVAPALAALTDQPLPNADAGDALRQAVNAFFAVHTGEWVVRVQLLRDPERQPIEDAATEWKDNESPWLTVARLTVPTQAAWQGSTSERQEDRLAFSPWQGLLAHQPLGSINRARRPAYVSSAGYRLSNLLADTRP